MNLKALEGFPMLIARIAISEGHGDAALVLLKAGAETDRRDVDGHLALELAPDSKVPCSAIFRERSQILTSVGA